MGEPRAAFANHRGVVPGLAVLLALGFGELAAVHILLLGLWPRVALPISGLTLLTLAWVAWWLFSWRRCPHLLLEDRLVLRMGAMRRVDVPLAVIARVHGEVTGEALRTPGTRNLVPVAFPNRLIELTQPLPGRRATRRIAIRLDAPAAFDAALAAAGVRLG